jgi:hypothetical protein
LADRCGGGGGIGFTATQPAVNTPGQAGATGTVGGASQPGIAGQQTTSAIITVNPKDSIAVVVGAGGGGQVIVSWGVQ